MPNRDLRALAPEWTTGYREIMRTTRLTLLTALLASATLALAGCAGQSPTPETTQPSEPAPPTSTPAPLGDAEAVWLDAGRQIGLVTWGSSSCVPLVGDVSADGQVITVSMSDVIEGQEPQACTADFAPRASVIGVPEGVDPQEDVTLKVTYDEQALQLELDGGDDLTGVPGEPTDYLPSAAWLDDDATIVLLTWGSSTCLPVIDSVESADDEVIVTFVTEDGVCTMDIVPRVTMIEASGDDDDRVLKLVGGNLDATVTIID